MHLRIGPRIGPHTATYTKNPTYGYMNALCEGDPFTKESMNFAQPINTIKTQSSQSKIHNKLQNWRMSNLFDVCQFVDSMTKSDRQVSTAKNNSTISKGAFG